jgi:hypothetical protein
VLGGVGASRRIATVVVAAGDIADCATEGDEATAGLVGGIEGTVLTLGDNAYPDGTAEDFRECDEPTWGQVSILHLSRSVMAFL